MSNSTKKVLEEIAPKIEWGNPLCKLAEVGQQIRELDQAQEQEEQAEREELGKVELDADAQARKL